MSMKEPIERTPEGSVTRNRRDHDARPVTANRRSGNAREKVAGTTGIYRRRTSGGATRFEICFSDSTGKQRWMTLDSLRAAKQARADLVSKVGRGEQVGSSRVRLGDYFDSWIAGQEGRLRARTVAIYRSNFEHVRKRLGRRRLTEVRVDDVARLVAELQREGLAGWTCRGVLTVLGRTLGSAERSGLIGTNPVRKLERSERPKVTRVEFPSLDAGAIGGLIRSTPGPYRCLVAVSVLTGIRQGEALGLQWQDVDVRRGTLTVRRQLSRSGELAEPKTVAARRQVPFPPSLGRMLAAHREQALARGQASPESFVFSSRAGTPLAVRNIIRRGLEVGAAEAGLPRLRWHDLRHLAASAMIEAGASVGYVSRVFGHASPAITLGIYSHAFEQAAHADRTREAMEQAFGGALEAAR